MGYYRQGPNRGPGQGFGVGVPRLTPYIKILIIVNIAMWLLQIVARAAGVDLAQYLGVKPAWIVGRGFIWQPLTYMFLHSVSSLFHLLFNMLVLWLFGSELETHWGSRPFLNYYLVCGVGAGLCATMVGLFNSPAAVTIGASGAIYGIIMAFGIVFAKRTVLFMMIFPMQARTFAWILFAISFISTWDLSSGVSHIAHLGGALTGFLYLKRAWRVGEFYREMRWKMRRRKFKMAPPDDPDDRWLN